MTDIRDLTIKIFGTTIPLHEERIIRIDSGEKSDHSSIIDATDDKEECGESLKAESQNEIHMQCGLEDTSCKHENKEDGHLSEHNNELDTENAKKEANQTVADSVQGNKTLKKPDKVLPCPRCNSLDTKFCYFNNYNVSQPRHFCKKCQRYWTDGGTMRNVPVGAGRRKSKHSSSHHRQIVVSSDGVPPTHIDTRNSSTHHQKISVIPKSGNGTILQFGPDGILCETVASVINLKDENRKMDHLKPVNCPKNVDQSSHVSYSSSTSHQEMKESPPKDDESRNSTGPPPLQFYAGPSWALPWNPMWGPTAPIASPGSSEVVCRSDNNNTNSIQWEVPSIVAVPPFCATNMPIPIMPTAYWSCMPGWIPWAAGPKGNHSLSSPTSNKALGKRHSRGGSENVSDDNDEEVKQEKSIWIPKSIRMDEADEALKSCIWDTLGINHDQNEQTSRSCGIFKAFQPKTGVKSSTSVSNQVLLANPSALARSRAFQESN